MHSINQRPPNNPRIRNPPPRPEGFRALDGGMLRLWCDDLSTREKTLMLWVVYCLVSVCYGRLVGKLVVCFVSFCFVGWGDGQRLVVIWYCFDLYSFCWWGGEWLQFWDIIIMWIHKLKIGDSKLLRCSCVALQVHMAIGPMEVEAAQKARVRFGWVLHQGFTTPGSWAVVNQPWMKMYHCCITYIKPGDFPWSC